ncbi:MAG: hypothetical protein KIS61_02665, partial [Candidatus Eremiobacteraeota bacterium]|nr:hypothetical protein [Candidatus Eremiobacteraeota bacterium]
LLEEESHTVLERMAFMLERYSNHLEDVVQQRTFELTEEKKRAEALLHNILPPSVAERLREDQVRVRRCSQSGCARARHLLTSPVRAALHCGPVPGDDGVLLGHCRLHEHVAQRRARPGGPDAEQPLHLHGQAGRHVRAGEDQDHR